MALPFLTKEQHIFFNSVCIHRAVYSTPTGQKVTGQLVEDNLCSLKKSTHKLLQTLASCLLNHKNVHPDRLLPGVSLDSGLLIQEMGQLSLLVPFSRSGV